MENKCTRVRLSGWSCLSEFNDDRALGSSAMAESVIQQLNGRSMSVNVYYSLNEESL